MRNFQVWALLLTALSLAGCAASDSRPASSVAQPAAAVERAAATGSADEVEIAQVREVAANSESSDDLICRREVQTGSHFSRRVCRTRAQVEAEREASQRSMRDRQRAAASTREDTSPQL